MLQKIIEKLEKKETIKLTVKVIPKSSRNEITEATTDHVKIKVTAAPENNKANASVIKILSKNLNIPKSKIQISRGEKSSNKVIIIKK